MKSDRITVRLPADVLAAIDDHRRHLAEATALDVSRAGAFAALVRRGLAAYGTPCRKPEKNRR
jgi:hypothetical protein